MRIPAASCGLFGFKATRARFPDGHLRRGSGIINELGVGCLRRRRRWMGLVRVTKGKREGVGSVRRGRTAWPVTMRHTSIR